MTLEVYWPYLLSAATVIIWGVRLEGKTKINKVMMENMVDKMTNKKDLIDKLYEYHEKSNTDVSDIKQAISRIDESIETLKSMLIDRHRRADQ